ncbi:thiamine diphosphate-binding protein [Lactarius vividus]|nr:thiamine diphosphate-binding protein [Lactarius vividus]
MSAPLDKFPIDLSKYKKLNLDVSNPRLTDEQRQTLKHNIQLLRDAIVLFTSTGAARGVSGHTGGPYDTVPELCILLSLFDSSDKYYPVVFDEAGHRVATQYLLSALEGHIPAEHLLQYRAAESKLPGHPELGLTPGVKFSSGRLGHMWPMVNGVALANRDKTVFCLGSDGSQQEGNDAEAARLAVAQGLNVKLIIDDNNVTIAGYPSEYLKGYELPKTLAGHGLEVITVQGEDIDALWGAFVKAVAYNGPAAIVAKRVMAPGVPDIEGSNHGHDVIPVKGALSYFKRRGYPDEKYNEIENILLNIKPSAVPYLYVGSTRENNANRVVFGEAVNAVLDGLSKEDAAKKVMVIDSDLEGSTGLKVIHQKHPEVFVPSGVMERGNFSAAAGFGFESDKFGVFSTFSAFLEMVVSEVTMARLNNCNVLCHFSHSGVDEIADNTCHFGINSFFADNGLDDVHSWLYFPADALQMRAVIKRVFFERGLRFVFSTRAKVPYLLKPGSDDKLFGDDYEFVPGKDEVILEGKDGYVVSYGDMLYRSYDAVLRVRQEGLDVGLVNKPTLNLVDEQVSIDPMSTSTFALSTHHVQTIKKIGSSPFVLIVESLSRKTGLGSRFGTWLLERQLTPKYGYLGTHKEGCGGLQEQITFQGLDPQSIIAKIKTLSD